MPSTVLVGLAVSSHVSGVTCTATFDSVDVSGSQAPPPPTLPAGWNAQDIGAVTAPGSASYSNPTFTLTGRGADVWGSADAFQYAYTTLDGDGTIVARVKSVSAANAWSKGGVMIRETVDPGSMHAFVLVSSSKGVAFQRRDSTGGASSSTAGSLSTAPRWVKLTRAGDLFTAYESADGNSWTVIGSDSIPMATSVLVGLGVTSHTTSATATVTFDGVSIQ
jgi:regulation of enolase protein 1 (concanavalin A-like superfamily)